MDIKINFGGEDELLQELQVRCFLKLLNNNDVMTGGNLDTLTITGRMTLLVRKLQGDYTNAMLRVRLIVVAKLDAGDWSLPSQSVSTIV